ncbi:MAG TPA: SHOCT domain-containing protein [Anaerolineales bacterium]|nr:SHOCT domain-containing protein [Anaerolineales bacterium]
MNASTRSFSVRKNFILLLLLTIGGSVILCWAAMIFIVIVTGGPIFQDKSQLFLDIFMAFIFPFLFATGVSVFSLILAAIVRQKWWIAVPISIFLLGLPLFAYVITWLASWVARIFYIPTPEDAERTRQFLSMSFGAKEDKQESKPDADIENLKKMKRLLEEGLITQEEFDVQKQKVVSTLSREAVIQTLPRYFSIWQTTIAAVLGGFLAGALLIAMDFKRLGDKDKFKGALIVGVVGYFVSILLSIFTTVFFVGIDPRLIIPINLVYPIIIYLWHNETLKPALAPLMDSKQARNESWWMVVGISFLVLVFYFISIFPIAIVVSFFLPAAG